MVFNTLFRLFDQVLFCFFLLLSPANPVREVRCSTYLANHSAVTKLEQKRENRVIVYSRAVLNLFQVTS